jgi:1,2-dihydroxy-3-keto-5-methylthiopentene dioxygenase
VVDSHYLRDLGVIYHRCPSVDHVNAIAQERDYKNRDEITVSPEKMGAVYEDKVKMFFNEHLHEDEEIRYILGGEGFFDVRNEGDEWVRIRLEKDDLIILPAGIYHRFTTDAKNVSLAPPGMNLTADVVQYIKAMRLFKEDPKWTPLNRGREVDENVQRQKYLSTQKASALSAH